MELGSKAEGDEVGSCVSFELVPLVPLHDMREVRMTLADLLAEGLALQEARNAGNVENENVEENASVEAPCDDGGGAVSGEKTGAGASGEPRPLVDPALDYLHVTLTDEHPQLDAMRKVHEVFPNAMTLDYDNAIILAAREQVRTSVDPDKVDALELFARFYEEQVGKPLDDVQEGIVAGVVREVENDYASGGEGAAR